jgi:hypothetical protein
MRGGSRQAGTRRPSSRPPSRCGRRRSPTRRRRTSARSRCSRPRRSGRRRAARRGASTPPAAVATGRRKSGCSTSGRTSAGRHCHSTRSLTVVGCHFLAMYTVILLSLLSFSVRMTDSPMARQNWAGFATLRLPRPLPAGTRLTLRFAEITHADGSLFNTVRARPGRVSALSVFHSESVLYGAFVWARRALNGPKRRFLARGSTAGVGARSPRSST